jgi:hypothetical protein
MKLLFTLFSPASRHSYLLGRILLITVFPNALSLCTSRKVWDTQSNKQSFRGQSITRLHFLRPLTEDKEDK